MSNNSNAVWEPKPVPVEVIDGLEPFVRGCVEETRRELAGIPQDLMFGWDNNSLVPELGAGGTTIRPNLIHLGFDPDF